MGLSPEAKARWRISYLEEDCVAVQSLQSFLVGSSGHSHVLVRLYGIYNIIVSMKQHVLIWQVGLQNCIG